MQSVRCTEGQWLSYCTVLRIERERCEHELTTCSPNVISPAFHHYTISRLTRMLSDPEIKEQLCTNRVWVITDSRILPALVLFKSHYKHPDDLHASLTRMLNDPPGSPGKFYWPRSDIRRDFLRAVWVGLISLLPFV